MALDSLPNLSEPQCVANGNNSSYFTELVHARILRFFFLRWTIFKVFIECVIIFQFFGCESCGILSPQSGIEHKPPPLKGKVLTTALPGKSLEQEF